jgi:hypothetical protein
VEVQPDLPAGPRGKRAPALGQGSTAHRHRPSQLGHQGWWGSHSEQTQFVLWPMETLHSPYVFRSWSLPCMDPGAHPTFELTSHSLLRPLTLCPDDSATSSNPVTLNGSSPP